MINLPKTSESYNIDLGNGDLFDFEIRQNLRGLGYGK
jgi:hypothetical protein